MQDVIQLPAAGKSSWLLRASRNKAAILLLTTSWVVLALAIANPKLAGLYHDDGIYLVCSKSLATGAGYRISSLPEGPYQTKYPILLPLLLTPVWWFAPSFPDNIRWFQIVIITFGGFLIFQTDYLLERVFKLQAMQRLLAMTLLVLSPSLLSSSQWILSEIPYAAISTTALLSYETRGRRVSSSRGSLFFLALLSSAAVLLKTHGFVLPLALAACLLLEHNWQRLLTYTLFVGCVLSPWWLWAREAESQAYSPLTNYYVSYQSTLAGNHSVSEWAMIIGQNVKYLENTFDHFLLVLIPILPMGSRVPIALLVFGIGVVLIWRRISRAIALYLVLYLSVVIVLPFHPYRHLIPILHLFIASVTLAVHQGTGWLLAHSRQIAKVWKHPLPSLFLLWLPIGVVLTSHATRILIALEVKARLLPDYVNFYESRMSGEGFFQTSDWIRRNIPTSDRIASPYDVLYFLYTGRQGTRYWFHNPKSYFYPDYLTAQRFVGDPQVIVRCLRDLKVRWLLMEPVTEDAFAEGKAVNQTATAIVQSGYPKSSLVFASRDGGHFIYKLEW